MSNSEDPSVFGQAKIIQLVKAEGGSTIQNVVQQVFIGDYERLRDAYIHPWPVFERVSLSHFVGREWLLAEVDAFLRDHDRGYFILEAEAGLGKTTFLAWLVRERGYINHFVELAPGEGGVVTGLRNLAAQLIRAWQLEDEIGGALPAAASRPDYLQSLLLRAAHRRDEIRPGEKIVLVVDALDEAGALPGQNVLGLSKTLPEGVFCLVSQRPVAVALHTEGPRRVFRLRAESQENLADMRAYLEAATEWPRIKKMLGKRGYGADQFVETLLDKCHGVWVYLHYAAHEIERGQRSPQDLDGLPDGLTRYYVHHWKHWRDEDEDKWYKVYLPVLATLAAAQEPVTAQRLTEWTDLQMPMQQLRRLLNEHWRPFLAIAGRGQQDRYHFYHTMLRGFFDGRMDRQQLSQAEDSLVQELAEATREAHRRIAEWYLVAWGGLEADLPQLPTVQDDESNCYGLRHLPAHFVHSSQGALLFQLIESASWAAAKPLTSPKAREYLDDLDLAFQVAVEGDIDLVVKAMGYVLRRGLVQEQITTPKPEAVIFLAQLGQIDWAFDLTRLRPLREQTQILRGISQSLNDKDPKTASLACERLAHVADDTSNLLDQCKLRCLAAQEMARLGLSSSRARAIADEAESMATYLPNSEFVPYQVEWALPTMAAVGKLEEALKLAESLSVPDHCRALRIIVQQLPDIHPQKATLAQRALDLAKAIVEENQSLEQQVYCLVTLAKSQSGQEKQQTIDALVYALDAVSARIPGSHVITHGIGKLAELDPSHARLLMEEDRWPDAFDAWPAIVQETARTDVDKALALLNERLDNWAPYPLVLVGIIEEVAREDPDKAEDLIKSNAERLKRNLDAAYLALARAYLDQGDQEGREQAEKIFYQPAFFVSDEHNVHTSAEMQLAMLENSAHFISPETARDWVEDFPTCSECGMHNERDQARLILVQILAYHERYDLLEKYTRREEALALAALALARKGNIAKAKEYINQQFFTKGREYIASARAHIAEFEARHNPSALDELVAGHYEADPQHHFCQAMIELPCVLDALAQVDLPPAVDIEDTIERMWNSIIDWQCTNDTRIKVREALGGQCDCHYKREQVLGQLVGTMARINQRRAQEMLEALSDSPSQVYAMTHVVQLGQVDEALLTNAKTAVLNCFQDPYLRAEAYYNLAAALPEEMVDHARALVAEAEPWLSEKPIYEQTNMGRVRYGISAIGLKELKARVLSGLIQQPLIQEQIDGVLSIASSLGAFPNKQASFTALFGQAEQWSEDERIMLLRYVLKVAADNGLTSIQAALAAAVPLVHSLGGDLETLLERVDWAYQRQPNR